VRKDPALGTALAFAAKTDDHDSEWWWTRMHYWINLCFNVKEKQSGSHSAIFCNI